jgi:hypothetical protein
VAAAEEEVFMGAARWLAGGRRRVLEPLDAQQTAEMGAPNGCGRGQVASGGGV